MFTYKILLDTGIGKIVPLVGTLDGFEKQTICSVVDRYLSQFDDPSNFNIVSSKFQGFDIPADTVLTETYQEGIHVKLHTDEIHLKYSFTNAEYSWEGIVECGQTDSLGEVIERKLKEDGYTGKYNVLKHLQFTLGRENTFALSEAIWHLRTYRVELEAVAPIHFELVYGGGERQGYLCVNAPVYKLVSDIATEAFENLQLFGTCKQHIYIYRVDHIDGEEVLKKVSNEAMHLDPQTYRVFFVASATNHLPPVEELNAATVAEIVKESNEKLRSQLNLQLADFVEKRTKTNDEGDDKMDEISAQLFCIKSMIEKMVDPKESAEYKTLEAQLDEVLRHDDYYERLVEYEQRKIAHMADMKSKEDKEKLATKQALEELEQLKEMNKTQQNYIQTVEGKLEHLKSELEENRKKIGSLIDEKVQLNELIAELTKKLKEKEENALQNEEKKEKREEVAAQKSEESDEADSTKPTVDFCFPEVVTEDFAVQKSRLLEEIRALKDEVSAHHMAELDLNLQLANLRAKYTEVVDENKRLERRLEAEKEKAIQRELEDEVNELAEEEKEEEKEEQKEENEEQNENKEEKDESSDPEDYEIVDKNFIDSDCRSTYSSAEE
ncbi:unnamed protein product [Bursaphelenchus xylophilus]|uniref:(pine wood nematode) hypothetical protein n=1 Tax=Bursaphelenchus xylophilus TaxID=6326 RepID=A0A1I7S9M6_BURXY|nr:unnamed protein product [Bursaphelenchus xylophilus]CAG9131927.1 unnamed protein product [Bursaphelenchus xylophilus]